MDNPIPNLVRQTSKQRNETPVPGHADSMIGMNQSELKATTCLFKKFEATRDSIWSRAVLASILLLLDSHGQSLANPFNDESPFRKFASKDPELPLRECPMKECHERFPTPLELINHLLKCDEAPKGNVQCGRCDNSHGMTRLLSPTQLWRRLSAVRKRGRHQGPSLAPPPSGNRSEVVNSLDGHFGQTSRLNQQSAKSVELEGDNFGHACFSELEVTHPRVEIDDSSSCGFLAPSSFETKRPQPCEHGLYQNLIKQDIQEMAVIEPALELDTSFSHIAPLPISSSTTLRQTSSRSWSGKSQTSTLFNNPSEVTLENSASMDFDLRKSAFRSSGSGLSRPLGPASTETRGTWIPDAPLTMSPETLVPASIGDNALWTLIPISYSQPSIMNAASACQPVPNFQLDGHDPKSIHELDEAPWQPSFKNVSEQWETTQTVPMTHVIGLMSIGGDAPQYPRHVGQPSGGAHIASHDVEDRASAAKHSALELDCSASPSEGHTLSRSNAFRAARHPKSKTQPSKEFIDADTDDKTLKCPFSNCNHRPRGQKKNLRSHLKRHMEIHKTERLKCQVRGCKTTFPHGRKDNLRVHMKKRHFLTLQKDGLDGPEDGPNTPKDGLDGSTISRCSMGERKGFEDDFGRAGGNGDTGLSLMAEDDFMCKHGRGYGHLLDGESVDMGDKLLGVENMWDSFFAWPPDSISAADYARSCQLELEAARHAQVLTTMI